ncbi:MAG TPA: phosphate acyltransferase, partial [Chloroflexota bacterium]|nr:phosphate acyltransferase [Chloroflexota bacterium]
MAHEEISREDVLEYHRGERPGKLQIEVTKPLLSQRDLSLAYSPGVGHAVTAVAENPLLAYDLTAKGNLVAVVTNGTAILGLGNLGPVPAKPVMEGKAALFKQLADVDVFDLELDCRSTDELVATIRALAPGFGGINLEDIAAPACFEVESRLRDELAIPVFHDDQHGTAIITGAALVNALELAGKHIAAVKVVVIGAGAAGVACARMYVKLGVRREHITMFDRLGMVYEGRTEEMDPYKGAFARPGPPLSLGEALGGADVLLEVSAANVVTPEMLRGMAPNPILFLLANPDPEIRYELALSARPDAIVATGRSDYPNQVNNVLVFPYLFRGALDVRATAVTAEMEQAAVRALAALAREVVPERVLAAYGLSRLKFGREYIIPKPNDYRALEWVASAVAEAARSAGVARAHIDLDGYRERLRAMQRRGWRVVHAAIEKARHDPRRIVFPEGENPRIIRAARLMEAENVARPVLLGRPAVVAGAIAALGLDYHPSVIDPEESPQLDAYAADIYALCKRKGLTLARAEKLVRQPNVFGLMMVRSGEADGFLSGLTYDYPEVLRPILQLIPLRPGTGTVAGVFIVISGSQVHFIADGLVNIDPGPEELAQIAILVADFVADFDIQPRIALVSFSNFGSVRSLQTEKVRRAVQIVRERRPDLEVDGEMQADTALSPDIVESRYPFSRI